MKPFYYCKGKSYSTWVERERIMQRGNDLDNGSSQPNTAAGVDVSSRESSKKVFPYHTEITRGGRHCLTNKIMQMTNETLNLFLWTEDWEPSPSISKEWSGTFKRDRIPRDLSIVMEKLNSNNSLASQTSSPSLWKRMDHQLSVRTRSETQVDYQLSAGIQCQKSMRSGRDRKECPTYQLGIPAIHLCNMCHTFV